MRSKRWRRNERWFKLILRKKQSDGKYSHGGDSVSRDGFLDVRDWTGRPSNQFVRSGNPPRISQSNKRLNSLEQRVAHYSYFLAASYAHSIPLIPKLSLDNVKGFFTCLAVFGLFVLWLEMLILLTCRPEKAVKEKVESSATARTRSPLSLGPLVLDSR